MRRVATFPHAVREIEHCWIPLADGCRLAARVWMPAEAERAPAAAILEYIPYRKRDGTRLRDEPMHRWFAGHGYAAVRVDLRGSGESEGFLTDEYTEQEQLDCVEVIRWIAAQPWCSGAVGMMGKSWGGFNALQVAARRPPELKAIVSVCSTDDRYADDAHYMGGCLLNENLTWGSLLLTLVAQPPDPALVGPGWRASWRERLERARPFAETWLRHPRRDDYWKHGSVCEDFGAIACPVWVVGGWADAYTNAVPRLLAGLRAPCRALVGPWSHQYPHEGRPGPAIGFLQEALSWWDRWLAGKPPAPGAPPEEPRYRVWMQESVPPHTSYDVRPGRWVAEDAWPSARIRPWSLALDGGRLVEPGAAPGRPAPVALRSPLHVGLRAGGWCGFGADGELPADQREDDGASLCFDSAPLADRVELLGAPRLSLRLASDRPFGMLAARLCDVAPDGASARVSYGLLDLTHRAGHERPRPLDPGRPFELELELCHLAHAFPAGHRLRLALSTSYWPIAWPAPGTFTLSLELAGARLALPVRPPRVEDGTLRAFEPPSAAEGPALVDLHPGGVRRTIERDLASGATSYTVATDVGEDGTPALTRFEEIDLEVGHAIVERFRITPDDPLSAEAEVRHEAVMRRAGWSTRVETTTRLTATRDTFLLETALDAREGDALVFERAWEQRIPRDLA